jgi:hypothetical protein
MSDSIRGREGPCEGAILAPVASEIGVDGEVGPDGIANGEVGNVARRDPGDHEDPKNNVADPGEAHVFKAFCDLCMVRDMYQRGEGLKYWEKKFHNIHQAKDYVGDFRLVITVTREYQRRRDDMVGEHLPMVLPSLLHVDDHDLLQPEGILNENVPL